MDEDRVYVASIMVTIHRSTPVPGGNGSRIGYSDDFPDKQFLIMPKDSTW